MTIKQRLDYLREQIKRECISYEEIAELEILAKHKLQWEESGNSKHKSLKELNEERKKK